MNQHDYDQQEMYRRRALIKAWTPRQRQLALHFLSTAAPEAFDAAARNRAFDETTDPAYPACPPRV